MKRRDFSRALVATTLTGTAVGFPKQSLAGDEGSGRDRGRDSLAALALVTLILAFQSVTLRAFGIANPNGFLGLSLINPVHQSLASRASGNKIPLFGKLFGMTVEQRLAGAILVGLVFLVGTILMLVPRAKPIRNVKKVVIVNDKIAYEPGPAPTPVRFSDIPLVKDIITGEAVGRAYQKGEDLIVIVQPSIIKYPN